MTEKQTLTVRKKNAILAAAVDEFLEKGFAAASMDSLAKRAEVSKRTVYNHFDSKEVLFEAIVMQLMARQAEMVNIEYDPQQPLEQQLRDFASKELVLLKSDRFIELARMMMAEFLRVPAMAEQIMSQLDSQISCLSRWVEAAMADGQLQQGDPSLAADQFIGLIKAGAFWPQLLKGAELPDEQCCQQLVDDAVLMFMARYGADHR